MDHLEHIRQLTEDLEREQFARHEAQLELQNRHNEKLSLTQEVLRLQQALSQKHFTEKRYHDLFSYSQALVCTHSMDGRLLTVNPAICKVMLYNQEELVGKKISDFMPVKRRNKFNDVYLPSIKNEKKAQGVLSIISKSGDKVYLLVENYKVEEEGAEPYIIGFCLDITERITAERKLVAINRESKQSARAKETFLANVSHEIRTPMNGILGVAELLAKTHLNDQQQNLLRLIQDSANNLLVIVNDVLELEKIVAGKLQLEKLPFKIVDKITTIVQSFIYRAEAKGLGIIYQNAIPANTVVVGDPFRLSQVLNNLLNNALKFTSKGNITITTGTKSRTDESVTLEFSVKDTGIGIKEQIVQQIFEPYIQAEAATSRKYGGTGLGLAICKNLIELQGGTLSVQSIENIGSVFTFSTPYILSKEVPYSDTTEKMNYSIPGNRKVLVAEDVELNQFIVKHMLESWGLEVSIAGDGTQALHLLHNNYFDLVLMDIQMPDMDGMAATRLIRAMSDPAKAAIPIIALTANALKSDSEKYLAAGMNDYISKPFREAKLFQVISRNLLLAEQSPVSIQTLPYFETAVISGESLYNLSTIRDISGGDEDFVRKMIELFIETVPPNVKDLNVSLDNENWEMVSKTAHKLKSTIDSMGITAIKEDIRAVELNAKRKESLVNIPVHIRRITTVIETCVRQLESELSHQLH